MIFYEDEFLKYDTSGFFGGQKVYHKKSGRSGRPSQKHIAKMRDIFSSFDIVKNMNQSQKNRFTVLTYKYFCAAVLGNKDAIHLFMMQPAQAFVIYLLSVDG